MPKFLILPRSVSLMFYWRWFNRPHHPLSRLLVGVVGLVLLAGVLALGLLALIAFVVIGAVVALTRAFLRTNAVRASKPQPAANVLEGEFVILPNRAAPIKH